MELRISRLLRDRIVSAAICSPAAEVCGLLLGNNGEATAAPACRNVAAEPARAFEIDPVALVAAHRAARSGGPAILGCWHSHPSGRAWPSPTDAAAALDEGWWWLIAGGGALGCFRVVAGGSVHGRFEPATLVTS